MSALQQLAQLRAHAPVIGPSLLACDFSQLGNEVRRLEQAGARMLHLDIMDGHFVPNLSFGIPIVEAVRRVTRLPLDVHLMISEPGRYVEQFRHAGADLLTFHIEVVAEPRPLLRRIRALGAAAGISLNPDTPLETIEGCLPECDLVLVMSVYPGFGGQQFHPIALEKLRRLRTVDRAELLLSVDGGVNAETIGPCAEAGADLFITGVALFSHDDYRQAITQFTNLARSNGTVPFSSNENWDSPPVIQQ
ncbi:MAG: ribulose-phosphate 3-epimerase [Thermoguttaceae bacterium]|jgi:ribulose-phosphate 3-epimerase